MLLQPTIKNERKYSTKNETVEELYIHCQDSRGSLCQETIFGRHKISKDVATIGSAVMWGIAGCPPFPSITTSKMPDLAKLALGFDAIVLVDWIGVKFISNLASTSPSAPSQIMWAVPPPPSLAGWKISLTVSALQKFMVKQRKIYISEMGNCITQKPIWNKIIQNYNQIDLKYIEEYKASD